MQAVFAEASSLRTAWRLHYNLPPTDPRYLNATEDEILEDAVLLAFRKRIDLETTHPAAVVAADAARDAAAVAESMNRVRDRLLDHPAFRAMFPDRGKKDTPPSTSPRRRVRLGGRR